MRHYPERVLLEPACSILNDVSSYKSKPYGAGWAIFMFPLTPLVVKSGNQIRRRCSCSSRSAVKVTRHGPSPSSRPDNIFDVERDVISNATGRRHRIQAGCTIGANFLPSPPIVALAVLHRRDLAKGRKYKGQGVCSIMSHGPSPR